VAHPTTKNWRTVRGQRSLDEREVAHHRRTFDAEAGLVGGGEDSRLGEDDQGDGVTRGSSDGGEGGDGSDR
jgi:hypothetical protein